MNWAISIEELVFTITNFQKTNLNNEKFKYRKGWKIQQSWNNCWQMVHILNYIGLQWEKILEHKWYEMWYILGYKIKKAILVKKLSKYNLIKWHAGKKNNVSNLGYF